MNELKLTPVDSNNETDISALVNLVRENYPDTAYPFTPEKAKAPGKLFFKVFLGEELVGMSGIDFKTPTLAETIKSIILKKHRGKGLGKILSQAIEDECRKRGVKKVMTSIYAHNHTMISIKLAQGYIIEGYHPDHEAPGFHEYSLGKKL